MRFYSLSDLPFVHHPVEVSSLHDFKGLVLRFALDVLEEQHVSKHLLRCDLVLNAVEH